MQSVADFLSLSKVRFWVKNGRIVLLSPFGGLGTRMMFILGLLEKG